MITFNNPKDTERRSNVKTPAIGNIQIAVDYLNKMDEVLFPEPIREMWQKILDDYQNKIHFYDNAGGWEGLAKLQETADSKGWISVDERLPEDEQDCIIYTGTQMFDGAIYWQSDKVWHVSEVGDLSTTEVTHWQPLPAPPKSK